MEEILGALFSFLGELLLEVLFPAIIELLMWLGFEGLGRVFRWVSDERPPWVVALGWGLAGLVSGALSLWLLPQARLHHPGLRQLALYGAPVLAGLMMSALAGWRRGETGWRLDRFTNGFLFAIALNAVRFKYAF